MLSVEEARSAILEKVRPLGPERVALSDALGRILWADLVSSQPHPAFDNSAMDGYAVRWSEVAEVEAGEPVSLPVSIEVPAGVDPPPLEVGTAARIMTGGRVPGGADTVVMREDTDESRPDRVLVEALPTKGRGAHIRRRGENIEVGDVALRSKALIGPGELGLLATLGHSVVSVVRRPQVAIIATGDELVEVGQRPGRGQIVNSSSWVLSALVKMAGGRALTLPIARDDRAATTDVFVTALRSADLVVSVGGVSVGDFDVVKAVLGDLCEGLDFWKVRMKPGKPLAFGASRGSQIPLVGLPGNPVSAFVSFWQFVSPALRKFLGQERLGLQRVEAVLTESVRSTPSRLDFQRGRAYLEGSRWRFVPFKGQGSGNPTSLVAVTGLAALPIGCSGAQAGETVEVQLLPGVLGGLF